MTSHKRLSEFSVTTTHSSLWHLPLPILQCPCSPLGVSVIILSPLLSTVHVLCKAAASGSSAHVSGSTAAITCTVIH